MTTLPRSIAVQERSAPATMPQRRFRTLDANVQLYVRDREDADLLPEAENVFHRMEARLSRFLPDSELSRLNARSGEEVMVTQTMFDVLERAFRYHRITEGVFDPAILRDLEAAGYDRPFERVLPSAEKAPREPSAAEAGTFDDVRLRVDRMTASFPRGMRIDLGGIARGYTMDAAAKLLRPAANFAINAGSDVIAAGSGPDTRGWPVAILDPLGSGESVALVHLHDQALATSTTARCRWQRGGRRLHHLIDPRTRRPSESGVVSASVIAQTATEADVFAKTALILGARAGSRFLDAQGAAGLFVLEGGACVRTRAWG